MASYAPMPYTAPMPYGASMPYTASPPSYAPQSYGTPSPYGAVQSAPIPLTPLVIPGDAEALSADGGGGGGGYTKFLLLPLIVLPILFLLGGGGGGGSGGGGGGGGVAGVGAGGLLDGADGDNGNETTPYYDNGGYGNDYQDENNNNRPNKGNQNRNRRQLEKTKSISTSPSTALPSMSIAQVDRLTQIIFAAMNSQECIQRLLCEVGSLSRSFSDTTQTVTKAVENYVPEKLKDSYNVFAKAENCDKYKCGHLKVKM